MCDFSVFFVVWLLRNLGGKLKENETLFECGNKSSRTNRTET